VRHAADSGADADRDEESVMYPTSQTETKTTRPRPGRPNTAPPYYPARPASVWITATTCHAGAPSTDEGELQ
jgi:hypothetical protein